MHLGHKSRFTIYVYALNSASWSPQGSACGVKLILNLHHTLILSFEGRLMALSLSKTLEKLEVLREKGNVEEGIQHFLEKYNISRKEAKNELQDKLLRRTITYVYANCPYYKQMFDKLGLKPEDVHSKNDLEKIPILDRETLRERMNDVINKNLTISSIISTSGTSGKFLHLYLSYDELFVLSQMARIFPGLKSEPIKRKTILYIPSPFHGVSATFPSQTHQIITTIFDKSFQESVIHKFIDDLTTEYVSKDGVGRVSDIVVFPPYLRDITTILLDHGIDPKEVGIEKIHTTGSHVSPALRAMARACWSAEITDSYSLAEVLIGNAAQCDRRTDYHFTVTVIPEVVDPYTGERLELGEEGLLVLTTLYPFQQTMPLLRYSTGDIVSLTDDTCGCGFEGISIRKIVGRVGYCIDLAKLDLKRRFLSPYDVYDIVDEIPEITYTTDASIHNTLPKFFVEKTDLGNKQKITIHVELKKKVGKEREEEIRRKVENQLEEKYPEIATAIRNGTFELETRIYDYSTLQKHYVR